MGDSKSLSGNASHEVTPPFQNRQTADWDQLDDAVTLDAFPAEDSDNSEDIAHAVEPSLPHRPTRKSTIFEFDFDPPVHHAPVLHRLRTPPRSVLRRTLSESADRARALAAVGTLQLAVGARTLARTASRVAGEVGLRARVLAAAARGLASAVIAACHGLGRLPRPRPLALIGMLSLVVGVTAFDRLPETSAGSATPAASSALSSAAIEAVVPTPVHANAVTPFQRLRPAIAQTTLPDRRQATRPPARAVRANHTRAIQSVLNRYRDALSVVDVAAVRAVWPGVNVAAVRSDFARVDEQNVEFDACRISSAGAQATASCVGVVESGLNPGQRRLRSQKKRWQFALHRSGDRWRITDVSSAAR